MNEIDLTIKNGWVLSAIFLMVAYIPFAFSKTGRKRLIDFSWMNKKGKLLSMIIMILFIIISLLPLFYYITENRMLNIAGYMLYVLGGFGIITSYINYFTTEQGKLITKGLYQYSRNPIYVFTLIMLIGIAFLCTSKLIAILLLIYFSIQHFIILEEEDFCKKSFGRTYEIYKKQTRRYV